MGSRTGPWGEALLREKIKMRKSKNSFYLFLSFKLTLSKSPFRVRKLFTMAKQFGIVGKNRYYKVKLP